jgi:type I restriction enzyme S subunit
MKTNQSQKNIPYGWDEVRLIDVVSFLDSKRVPIESDERSTRKGIYPYYGASGIIDYIDDYIFDGEFILLGEDGANILDRSSPLAFMVKGKIWVNNHAHVFKAKENIKLYFLSEYLESLSYEKFNTGSAQPKLNRSVCEKIPVLLPPLPEQTRIVSVLETWDKSIENLNKKIEIKKQIKKGLMQDLLTGKKRLCGFKDKWGLIRLGDIGEFRTSSVDKKTIFSEKVALLCNYMDVYKRKIIKNTDIFQKITAKDGQIESSSLKIGDVLFTPSSETPEDIGYSAVVQSTLPNLLFSYHLVRFRPNKNILDVLYSSFCFNQVSFRKYLSSVSAGVTRFTLSKSAFENAVIKLPDIKEQKAIADILTTVDKEISELENKLKIIKDQKKFLLNNLITGEIRTPENLKVN